MKMKMKMKWLMFVFGVAMSSVVAMAGQNALLVPQASFEAMAVLDS